MTDIPEELEVPYWRLADQPAAPLRATVRAVARIIGQAAPRAAAAVLVLHLVGGLATAAALLATTDALSALLDAGLAADRIRAAAPALALVSLAVVVRGGCAAGAGLAQARVTPRVRRVAEEQLIDASLHATLSAYDDPAFYDRMHRARDRGLYHLEEACDNLVEVAGAFFAVVAATASLGALHPVLVPVLLLAVAPQAWAVLRSARLEYASMSRLVAVDRRISMIAELATRRESAAEIRACQAEDFVLADYRKAGNVQRDEQIRVGIRQAKTRAAGRLAAGAGLALTFVVLGLLLSTGWMALAAAGSAVIAIRAATAALTEVVLTGNRLVEHGRYVADYQQFLDDARRRARPRTGLSAPQQPLLIELREVSFTYDGTERPALRSITLTLRAGQVIALVGENGSGKTTLAKVIAGLYQPTAGQVCWDGMDIAAMNPSEVADRIVMVQQEPVRWPHTARKNVQVGRYGRHDPAGEYLTGAAARSGADEVVAQLPRGWDTLLSRYFRGGLDLSGGQWQRLAVARGLYRDAPILIWDEPTAPLDAKAEYAVYETLRRIANGRTVILITHRLSSIRHADHIYLLHEGDLVEHGTHDDLLARGGRYTELLNLQTRLHGEGIATPAPR